jgi:hypothetical protein
VFAELWIMLPDQPFALGRVGHGNFSPSHSSASKDNKYFMVYSRTIKNEKYRASSDQYYMVMSQDMDKAIKNAKKHIRPYNPAEFAQESASQMKSEVGDITRRMIDARRSAERDVLDIPLVYKELKHLVDLGHQFLDPRFASNLAAWVDAKNAVQAETSRAVPVYFVYVSTQRDEQVFDVVEIPNIKEYSYTDQMEFKRFKLDDMPEDIMGKLSVLSLLEPGQYTEGVGKRVDEAMFWVERT